MTYQDVLSKVDHTVLKQTATWADIQKLCDDAVKYHTASICIPPAYVKQAAEYLNGRIPVCTVIGFPNGSNTTESKAFEVRDAVKNGAEELDMVVNIGWVKDGKYEDVLREVRERDRRDMTREISPLRRADDACLVDSSDMTIEQVVDAIMARVEAARRGTEA